MLAFALAAALPPAATAQPGSLRAEFWIDAGGLPKDGAPPTIEGSLALLGEEATYVLSGCLYGFSFEWTPSDLARGIAESFTMRPLATIGQGDPLLAPEPARRSGDLVSRYVSYAPDEAQRSTMDSFLRAPWRSSSGMGAGTYLQGLAGRIAAYEDAGKEAVRGLLRSYEPNKPRRVRGRLAFEGVPTIGVMQGKYLVQGRFRVAVDEVLGYGLY